MGCSSGMEKSPVVFPSSGLVTCPEPPKALNGRFPTLFNNHLDLLEHYNECKTRHNILVDHIKKNY